MAFGSVVRLFRNWGGGYWVGTQLAKKMIPSIPYCFLTNYRLARREPRKGNERWKLARILKSNCSRYSKKDTSRKSTTIQRRPSAAASSSQELRTLTSTGRRVARVSGARTR